ncbi:hypothetical protein LguiB_005860 [Lonicera macranthoides]
MALLHSAKLHLRFPEVFLPPFFTESSRLASYNKKPTITSREIQTAVRLVLPGELAKHTVSEGTKAVTKFTNVKVSLINQEINMPGEKSLHINNGTDELHTKKRKRKPKIHGDAFIGSTLSKEFESKGGRKNDSRRNKSSSNKSSFRCSTGETLSSISPVENVKSRKLKRKGKRKRSKDSSAETDEASRLQRRARNLMIKMKFEQNLIDAYSGEGWKGQSREKIRPEKELQRAMKQILKCKLGIRDAIRQLDSLSSEGCIEDSAIAPDGSVYHEHIFCAKCKLREAFPDNDIILCDVPQGDEAWFCKFCECKMDILDAMNAHTGTHFSVDSNWQDIFKEEADLPDGGDALLHQEEEWPSDESDDDDYDPENFDNSCNQSRAESKDNTSESESASSSSLCILEGDLFFEADSDETTDCEVLSGRRQRRAVDYKKLYDASPVLCPLPPPTARALISTGIPEMFGKDAPVNEQISEDEDWGPTKRRKRREKECDAASTLMTLCEESEKKCPNENNTEEKLRCVFAENELPSKAVRDNLSEQLGLDSEKVTPPKDLYYDPLGLLLVVSKCALHAEGHEFKPLLERYFIVISSARGVNKWFKNARYLALKARKLGRRNSFTDISPRISKEAAESENAMEKPADQMLCKDDVDQALESLNKKLHVRNNFKLLTSPSKKRHHKEPLLWSPIKNKDAEELGDDMSLKLLREKAKREKRVNFNAMGNHNAAVVVQEEAEAEAEAEMERLCKIKSKVEKLQQVLLALPNPSTFVQHSVIYVPIAELREKKI